MALDDLRDVDDENLIYVQRNKRKKQMLVFLAVLLVFFAFSFALYQAVYKKKSLTNAPYKIVFADKDVETNDMVFYTFPDISVDLSSKDKEDASPTLTFGVTFEFENAEQISSFEAMSPKINDMLIFMFKNLYVSEINSSKSVYWLKEEILHRANLLVSPINIESVSFNKFKISGDQSVGEGI